MTYEEACDYLLSLPRFTDQGATAYRPGLDHMIALMEAMGNPHRRFESIHVAGTNGKGSTVSFIAAIAASAGLRVGLHTSPHLFRITERMRINGRPAPDAWLSQAVERYRSVFESVKPSFFEATVALSFLYFAEQKVDLAVVEVGMGGRLDATNVILPRLSAITSIDLDHTEFLGNSLPEIAREKAGIIKDGIPVVTSAEQPEVIREFREIARQRGSPFAAVLEEIQVTDVVQEADGLVMDVRTPVRDYPSLRVGLPGPHQQKNALLALRAAEIAIIPAPEAVYEGLANARILSGLRGRLEVIQKEPLVIVDVSHNPEGLSAALKYALDQAERRKGRLFVLFGAMRDKDVSRMAALLARLTAAIFLVSIRSERALRTDELSAILAAEDVVVVGSGTTAEGLSWFNRTASFGDVLLITGSHQVVSGLPEEMFT